MRKGKPGCYYCKGKGFCVEENGDGEREAYQCDCTFEPEVSDFDELLDELSEKDFVHDP